MSTSVERIAPAHQSVERPCGYHRWSNLLFLHWRVPTEELQRLLPARLSVDTCDGEAWIGLVPFVMSGVRPRWFPALPIVSRFCETNVRTYVHLDGGCPGVWFFSLDASCSLAVRVARRMWHLNYFRSRMSVDRSGENLEYRSRRLWPEPADAAGRIQANVGEVLNPDTTPGRPVAGSLEEFLVDRYYLYTQSPDGRIHRGRVRHEPYPLRWAEVSQVEQTLLPTAGADVDRPPEHALFCEGVDVDVFPLRPV